MMDIRLSRRKQEDLGENKIPNQAKKRTNEEILNFLDRMMEEENREDKNWS